MVCDAPYLPNDVSVTPMFFYVFKSVSMRKPGRTKQEVIQLKSLILLKLGIDVGFGE